MMNSEESKQPKRQVTVEDLLHLKRAERPPAEFWIRFEQELRAKQLAAIVVKRSWWSVVPEVFAGMRRYQVLLGTAAVLAVSFVSVNEYRSSSPAVASSIALASTSEAPVPAREISPPGNDVAVVSTEVGLVIAGNTINPAVAIETASLAPAATLQYSEANLSDEHASSVAVSDNNLSEIVPWLTSRADLRDLSPAAQSIADNLTAIKETHPELIGRLYGSSGGFEKRGLPAPRRPAVDPLAQMRNPSDTHRERLLASATPVAVRTSGPSGERIAGRISDQRLTEQEISRFGARGDRFLVKF
jgi:hypothetical protein